MVDETLTESQAVKNTSSTVTTGGFKKIAQVKDWSLWEAKLSVSPSAINEFDQFVFRITTHCRVATGTILIDDVRIQPTTAELTCYVYDPNTLRLLAQFDDQHLVCSISTIPKENSFENNRDRARCENCSGNVVQPADSTETGRAIGIGRRKYC